MLISIPRASRAHRSQLDALRFPLAATESMFCSSKPCLASDPVPRVFPTSLYPSMVGTRSEGARKLIFQNAHGRVFPPLPKKLSKPQSATITTSISSVTYIVTQGHTLDFLQYSPSSHFGPAFLVLRQNA